jgi:hypothetical protein
VLETQGAAIAEERSSRKNPLTDDDVQALLERAETVIVAKGKKIRTLAPSDTVLDDLKGPTGNYRAPILLIDAATLLVGFHSETLGQLVA